MEVSISIRHLNSAKGPLPQRTTGKPALSLTHLQAIRSCRAAEPPRLRTRPPPAHPAGLFAGGAFDELQKKNSGGVCRRGSAVRASNTAAAPVAFHPRQAVGLPDRGAPAACNLPYICSYLRHHETTLPEFGSVVRTSQQTAWRCARRCRCACAPAPRRPRFAGLFFRIKIRKINALSGCPAILTWLYAVSMVRAAFKVVGR